MSNCTDHSWSRENREFTGSRSKCQGWKFSLLECWKLKKIVSAGFSCSQKSDGVSMQLSWESGNNEHTNPNYNFMKRNLAELIEDSAKPTKGWRFDKAVSKTRKVGWRALSSCVESLFLTNDEPSRNKTAPDSCSETAPQRAKRFWSSCSTSMSCKSGKNFFGGEKKSCS